MGDRRVQSPPRKDASSKASTSTASAETADTDKADTSADSYRTEHRRITHSPSAISNYRYMQHNSKGMPPAILQEIVKALSSPTGSGGGRSGSEGLL